ncbi:DNA polymerase III subunit chi [Poseidonocella sedimentorum]|uniref:DNA polymerase III, chi subunit n=1 Tax=Poseidonocella sedimentorum TaxID=871652 RepID=A0A1I6DZD6_9RHOB|nr:DNA polymerase III subunit chi [Poseidonocella sedimentorum]SFR10785.1 DNA polymerase III, chi subunit [Poseidonocella sedimentorum]
MGAVYFYHLTRSPLERAVSQLLERALGAGWRVAVRGGDEARLRGLDEQLWRGPEDGFLPHGLAGGEYDAQQPVLLTTGAAGNDPACWMLIDGAAPDVAEIAGAERTFILFDGHDDAALNRARGQWKTLVDAGCAAVYWSEESGRWEKKAESGG